jgi:hypothetical protein
VCEFISTENIAPGWGCCRCRVYNGLQRVLCRMCWEERHEIKVPDDVVQCSNCGFGGIKGKPFKSNLAGQDFRGVCPSCGSTWPEEVVQ